jgi:hypothetical protein
VSDQLRRSCKLEGHRLKTATSLQYPLTLAQIYPHPALLRLMAVKERVKFKAGKTTAYWRGATRKSRVSFVRHELRKIGQRLDERIVGVVDLIDVEKRERLSALKPVEDKIDAIIWPESERRSSMIMPSPSATRILRFWFLRKLGR